LSRTKKKNREDEKEWKLYLPKTTCIHYFDGDSQLQPSFPKDNLKNN